MQVIVPVFSEKGSEAIVTMWHVEETETIKQGEDLLEVVTDKASFDFPSPCSGVLIAKKKIAGEKVAAGDIVAEIKEDEDQHGSV